MPRREEPSVSDRTTQKMIEPTTGPKTVAAPPSSMIVQMKNVSYVP